MRYYKVYSGNSLSIAYPDAFLLNMQMIFDYLSERFEHIDRSFNSDTQCLAGLFCYQPGKPIFSKYLYIALPDQFPEGFCFQPQQHFLIIGHMDLPASLPKGCCIIETAGTTNYAEIMNYVQTIFEMFHTWDLQLHAAIYSDDPLDTMIEASLDIFHNPVFIHDTSFYILTCPRHVSGMSEWVRDPKTGRDMAPLSLVNDFKVDMEYLSTLGIHGSSMYSRNLRGYRILFINLWDNHRYTGRICIDELQSTIFPSHYTILEYLAHFVEYCLHQHMLFSKSMGMDLDAFFTRFLDGSMKEESEILTGMEYMNWKRTDRYLCLRMESENPSQNLSISATTIGHIEIQIPDGNAFVYKNGINIIVNLSSRHSSADNVISSLAIIIREGLFKMGASYEFNDFLAIPQGFHQAKYALRLGKKSGSMSWCYRFNDFLLEHVLSAATAKISPEMLYARQLLLLKNYDQENNTELFHTLNVYLNLERNVLQTAKTLFIHRSTLFYRLERIQKLTKLNLDDPKQRLCLLLSFAMLENAVGTFLL